MKSRLPFPLLALLCATSAFAATKAEYRAATVAGLREASASKPNATATAPAW